MSIIFLPEVQDYLDNLVPVLYEKGYFVFEDTATKYVDGLIDDIQNNLSKKQHRLASKHYEKYGKDLHYAAFSKNKHTTWYAFFTKYKANEEIIFLVRYIGNNHTEGQYLFE